MSEKPTTPGSDRVSFQKSGREVPSTRVAGTQAPTSPSGRGRLGGLMGSSVAADGSALPPAPKQVRLAALALAVASLGALVAAASLFGLKGWLLESARKSNNKLKVADRKNSSQLHSAVNHTLSGNLIASIVLVIALSIVARAVLRGRYWARWTVIALWVLATLTGTFASFTYLIGVASSEPIAFKIPSFIAALALLVAVAMVSLRPSAEYFALTKPPRPDGAPARRGGLFGARPGAPAPAVRSSARSTARNTAHTRTEPADRTAAASGDAPATETPGAGTERSRAKQRATADSVAKGAELARARAKASKSRRTGV